VIVARVVTTILTLVGSQAKSTPLSKTELRREIVWG
jgi:hypothetical protein